MSDDSLEDATEENNSGEDDVREEYGSGEDQGANAEQEEGVCQNEGFEREVSQLEEGRQEDGEVSQRDGDDSNVQESGGELQSESHEQSDGNLTVDMTQDSCTIHQDLVQGEELSNIEEGDLVAGHSLEGQDITDLSEGQGDVCSQEYKIGDTNNESEEENNISSIQCDELANSVEPDNQCCHLEGADIELRNNIPGDDIINPDEVSESEAGFNQSSVHIEMELPEEDQNVDELDFEAASRPELVEEDQLAEEYQSPEDDNIIDDDPMLVGETVPQNEEPAETDLPQEHFDGELLGGDVPEVELILDSDIDVVDNHHAQESEEVEADIQNEGDISCGGGVDSMHPLAENEAQMDVSMLLPEADRDSALDSVPDLQPCDINTNVELCDMTSLDSTIMTYQDISSMYMSSEDPPEDLGLDKCPSYSTLDDFGMPRVEIDGAGPSKSCAGRKLRRSLESQDSTEDEYLRSRQLYHNTECIGVNDENSTLHRPVEAAMSSSSNSSDYSSRSSDDIPRWSRSRLFTNDSSIEEGEERGGMRTGSSGASFDDSSVNVYKRLIIGATLSSSSSSSCDSNKINSATESMVINKASKKKKVPTATLR